MGDPVNIVIGIMWIIWENLVAKICQRITEGWIIDPVLKNQKNKIKKSKCYGMPIVS